MTDRLHLRASVVACSWGSRSARVRSKPSHPPAPATAEGRGAACGERLVSGTARLHRPPELSGTLVGLMKSLDQGAQAPATVAVRGDTFSFAIAAEHITYAARV